MQNLKYTLSAIRKHLDNFHLAYVVYNGDIG